MATSGKDKRWFDEEDFTPEHDEMMLDLMETWRNYLELYSPTDIKEYDTFKFVGEPCLEGYPPVYPDGIIYRIREVGHVTPHIVFEIKPKINSFGAILRQLRIYEERVNSLTRVDYGQRFTYRADESRGYTVPVLLITKDHRYDDQFRRQGIMVEGPDV